MEFRNLNPKKAMKSAEKKGYLSFLSKNENVNE